MIAQYRQAEVQRRMLGVPPLPLSSQQVSDLTRLLEKHHAEGDFLVNLLAHLRTAVRLLAGESYAKSRMWLAPLSRIDRDAIRAEGGLSIFGQVGCRVEVPGCSLSMGNQARVQPQATFISTSTRNFDNRLGDGARVNRGSTELTVISGLLGRLPDVSEYFAFLENKSAESC